MRPSLSRLIRIIPKDSIKPTQHHHKTNIVPPPLTRQDETPMRVKVSDIMLERKTEGLKKEANGELAKGEGWPVNLRVEKPLTKKLFKHVDKENGVKLKELLSER